MRKGMIFGAGLAAMVAGVASANVVVDLGSHTLFGGEWVSFDFELTGNLTGFNIEFDYVTNTNGSWASDLGFVIDAPNDDAVQFGGFNVLYPGATDGGAWAFDGSNSAGSGFYEDKKDLAVSGDGTWTLRIGNAWSLNTQFVEYNNIIVTLKGVEVIPAPGVLALIGLAGLTGVRRRRA